MIKKAHKIPKSLFLLAKRSQVVSSPLFTVRFSDQTQIPRFACVVSKKITKNAVQRNLLIRRVFSIIQKMQNLRPYLYFIYPNSEAAKVNFKHLEADLLGLCARIK